MQGMGLRRVEKGGESVCEMIRPDSKRVVRRISCNMASWYL